MFNFNLPNNARPSQELFGWVLLGFIALLGAGAISMKIEEWKNSKRPPAEKLKIALERFVRRLTMSTPGNYDHFPEKYGVDDAKADEEYGGHWIVDPNKKSPNITATGIIPVSEFERIVNAITSVVTKVNGIQPKPGCEKAIDAAYSSALGNVVKFKDKAVDGFNVKTTKVTWPNCEYYKDSSACFKKMQVPVGKLIAAFKNSIGVLEKILALPTEGASDEDLRARVTVVASIEFLFGIFQALDKEWEENFYRLAEVDVGFYSAEDKTFDYL